jgi:superfamily II DNA or RNA helicase
MPAFKLGRWDGKISFATVGGSTHLQILDRVLPIVLEAGYEPEIEDLRKPINVKFPEITESLLAHKKWPEGHPAAGQPIMLRDYQVQAIKNYTDNIQSLQQLSTGAGKTIVTAALSMLVEEQGRSIVIVPSKTLVEQTEEDYKNVGLDVGVFFGDRKEWNHKHTICTWQSLSVFAKKTRRGETAEDVSIHDFLKDVVCVMVDECHTIKGQELRDLLCGDFANIPIRWGLTGTIPKEEFEFLNLLVSIGPVVGEVKAKDLQDQGVLSECQIEIIQTDDSDVSFRSYQDEYKFLVSNPRRLDWVSAFAAGLDGNTLILVDRIETGQHIQDAIEDCVFINGTVKSEERKREFKSLGASHGTIMVATYGTMSTGVNIPKIHNLILIECGKSPIRTIQSVGRILRKAPGKSMAYVYDVCSNLKYSKKHLTERKKSYADAQYPFTINKVKY